MKFLELFPLLAILFCLIITQPLQVKAMPPTLADSIQLVLDRTNFNTGWIESVHYGVIFNRMSLEAYESVNYTGPPDDSYDSALWTRRMAQIDGYGSPTLDANAQNALRSMVMIGHIPMTYAPKSCWLDYQRFACEAFDWAESWGVPGWEKQACFGEVLAAYQSHGSPLLGYPGYVGSLRYYDEYAQSMDIFNKLNGSDSGLWQAINSLHWNPSARLYSYTPGTSRYECEAGSFAFIVAYYRATHGDDIPNFDRIATDLDTKFLANGWSSRGWGQPGIVQHATGNPQLRLQNSFVTIAAMQLYSKIAPWQADFVRMLDGTTSPSAWQGALSSSLFNGTKFAWASGELATDTASAVGLMMLFLEGIIPDTGSLAVPISEERYEDALSFTPASHFNYDSDNHKIRIPVWAGMLKFQFGSQTASAVFPTDGIYDVQFSGDWNTVMSVNKISPLSPNLYYLKAAPASPSYNATIEAHCNEEYTDVNVSVSMDGVPAGFSPVAFNNLVGEHTFTVPAADQNGHPFKQWNTGEPGSSLRVAGGGTFTAYYQARHTVNVTSTAGGFTNPTTGVYSFWSGTVVSVTAAPYPGYMLDRWELDGIIAGAQNPLKLTMNRNHVLCAVFGAGQPTYEVGVKAACLNEGEDVIVNLTSDGSPTQYPTPCVFSGLNGTHTLTAPDVDGSGHSFDRWSTGEMSTTLSVSSGGTYTAYYRTPPVHAIAATAVTLWKAVVGQGYVLNVSVGVINMGDYTETFSIKVYAEATAVCEETVTLGSGASATRSLFWNTMGFAYGSYNVSVVASQVPGETYTLDNRLVAGAVKVSIPGDVDGNLRVDMEDVTTLLEPFGSMTGHLRYSPVCDLDANGKVDMGDLVIALGSYGRQFP